MSAEAYFDLIQRTGEGCYYLWGPIKNALLMEFMDGNSDLIFSICTQGSLTKDGAIPIERKDMLIQVLTNASYEKETEVKELLWQIARLQPKWFERKKSHATTEAKCLAAEVAGTLQMSDILKYLMLDKNEDVRRQAVRSIFYLWRAEKSSNKPKEDFLSLKVLKDLGDSKTISRWVIPSKRQLQSCFEFSLSLLLEDYHDQEITTLLKDIWAGILEKLLWHRAGRASHQISKVVRSVLLRVTVSLMIRLAISLEKKERMEPYDLKEMTLFFKSSDSKYKAKVRKLSDYLNPNAGCLEDVKDDLRCLSTSRDLLSFYLLEMVGCAHILAYPKQTLVVIKELFEEAIKEKPPGLLSIPAMLIALSGASDGKSGAEIDPDILKHQEEFIVQYQIKHNSICQGKTDVSFFYSGLSSYPQYSYRKNGRVNKEVLQVFIDNAKTGTNVEYFQKMHHYILNVAVPGHPQYRDMSAILESLEPALEGALKDVELQKDLVTSLAKIKVYAPTKVEHFMIQQGIPDEIIDRVRRKSSEEEMASAVIGTGVFFIRDAILLNPDGELSKMLIWWFKQAAECPSLSAWINLLVKRMLNGISNVELFQV